MRVSLNWIARLLGLGQRSDLGVDADELVERLTRAVAEIDEVEVLGANLSGVVVGKVLSCAQHPNADRLRCTTVDVGSGEPLPIVCGAPNVAEGQTVAVATVGTSLSMPGKDGSLQSITIKAGKLRGEASHGMICAEDELGLGDSHDGIMVLDEDLAAGTDLAAALGVDDAVLVIDNHAINHRPDLWGHLGWAREVAALLDLPFTSPYQTEWSDSGDGFAVSLDDAGCRSYFGAVVDGVGNGPSPAWMQQLLTAAGVRPLGLLVDVTNYVMLELGEPMHAFDRRAIAGDGLKVRSATAGEAFTTLDGKAHELRADDLLIADDERALALAGIMGGEGSMVQDDTTSIVLEAAIFDPARIRTTRLAVGFGTDSSSRFEKGLFPEMAPAAINRAIEVLQAEHPGLTVSCRFHQGDAARPATTLPLPGPTVERITGLAIDADTQKRLLGAIGFACEGDTVTVPWWRAKDVTRAVELVEEVARQFGYEHLTAAAPRMPTTVPARNRERESEHRLRRSLSGRGWDEIASYVFTSDAWAERLGWDEAERIAVRNPCASDQTIMRRSLVPGLLDAVIRNRRNFDRVQVYEIGRIYGQGIGLAPKVDECLVWSGACASADETPPFYGARDAAIGALADLGYTATIDADALLPAALIPGRGCGLVVDGMPVGLVGEFTRELVQDSGGDESVAFFTVDLERLVRDLPEPSPIQFTVPSRYQAVDREFTFVCPEGLPYATVAAAAAKGAGKLFKGADLVTVYRGDPIANGQKALSLRITLCSDDKSLGDKDLQKAERKIIGSVENQTPAKLRA